MSDKNVAVILAGGIGERMRLSMPKQLLKIAGKSIIDHTLAVFQGNDNIDEIVVMMTPGYAKSVGVIVEKYSKISTVLEGGTTRNETSEKAIEYVDEKHGNCNIIFHDAVRPFVSDRIIDQCIQGLLQYNAIDVAIPSSDTIIEVSDQDIITDIPDRSRLRRGQTPQAFKLDTIKEAYRISKKDKDFKATDDCGVVLKYLPDEPIYVVEGSDDNMKVTQPVDAFIADKLFQISSRDSIELSDGDRRQAVRGKTVVVFGGGYGIGKDIADIVEPLGANVFRYSRSLNKIDVTREQDVINALQEAYDETGRVDFVVNTAGELVISDLNGMDSSDIESAIRVNYTAPVLIAKHSFPYLQKTSGHLVLFTSSSYTRGRPSYSLYSSSKAATVNLVQALAEEWIDSGVKVNCINPERTATPMRTKAFGKEDKSTLLDPRVVADRTIDTFLGSLTGQVVDVRRS